MLRVLSIISLLCLSGLLHTQEPTLNFFRSTTKNERFEAGTPIFSGMIIPVYTPEMGFSFDADGVITFKTKRNNPYLLHSEFPASLNINTEGSYTFIVHPRSFWFDNLVFIEINAEYRNMADNYWGVGMENGNTVEKGNTTTAYKRESYVFQPSILFRAASNLYAGFIANFNSFTAAKPAELMLEDPEILNYGTDIFSGGIGIMAFYDTRNPYNPFLPGFYLKIKRISYLEFLNSDNKYQKLHVDYCHYFPIIRNGSIIAFQLKSSWSFGNVPWINMAQPGGADDLRGYYQGQYRHNNSIIILAEYRHFFNRPQSGLLSRHGFAYWLGGGTVFKEISDINDIIMSTGAGYRYRFQPNIILRIDIGFGTENVGIYLGLTEAF